MPSKILEFPKSSKSSLVIHQIDGGVGLRKGCSYPEYREEDAIPANVVFMAFPKKG